MNRLQSDFFKACEIHVAPKQRAPRAPRPSLKLMAIATLLVDGCWHSNVELLEVGGVRYGARLYELRRRHGIDWEKAIRERETYFDGRTTVEPPAWFYRVKPGAEWHRLARFVDRDAS